MFVSISWHISYLVLPHTNQSKQTLALKNKMDFYDANKSESRQIFINLNYPDNQTRKKPFYIFCIRLRIFFSGVCINFIDYVLHCHVLNQKFFDCKSIFIAQFYITIHFVSSKLAHVKISMKQLSPGHWSDNQRLLRCCSAAISNGCIWSYIS